MRLFFEGPLLGAYTHRLNNLLNRNELQSISSNVKLWINCTWRRQCSFFLCHAVLIRDSHLLPNKVTTVGSSGNKSISKGAKRKLDFHGIEPEEECSYELQSLFWVVGPYEAQTYDSVLWANQ